MSVRIERPFKAIKDKIGLTRYSNEEDALIAGIVDFLKQGNSRYPDIRIMSLRRHELCKEPDR